MVEYLGSEMLDYEKQMFLDILQEDGLLIAAKGLGLDFVIVSLLKVYCDTGNLVFVLGAEDKFRDWLVNTLVLNGVNPPPRIVSSELGASERQLSYLEGGLWFVPSRTLIVDIIKKRIPLDLVTGLVVCKAHNILKNHQDSFVIRLFRQGNKTGFIKAFSNEAASFKGSLIKVERILKTLFVRNLFLWPRYHATVKSTLNQCKPVVVELHLEMTSRMVQLQNALLDLINNSVQELRRLNPLLDMEEVTVENAISRSFHKLIHSQLDPIWHTLSERTKVLLADLKLFHHLIMSLLILDSVCFFSVINSLRKADCAFRSSGWHLLPSAEILFTVAKQRVFGSANNISDVNDIDIEPNPKWLALSQIISEIFNQARKMNIKEKCSDNAVTETESALSEPNTSKKTADTLTGNSDSGRDILILVRDENICSQLRGYLMMGSAAYLRMQYQKYFFNKKIRNNKSEENSNVQVGEDEGENALQQDCEGNEMFRMSLKMELFSQLETNSEMNLTGLFEEAVNEGHENEGKNEMSDTNVTEDSQNSSPPVIVIKSYNNNLMYLFQMFQEMKPKWVIMYDSDMTIVRQLEVYQRYNPVLSLMVYFLIYGGTVEEQAYLTSLRKEKEAFDYLIQEKARIVIPEDRSDCPELTRDITKASDITLRTRKGGLEKFDKSTPKIVVDMREFRSELPALIHARGIDIEPLTIAVGDYILTPDICLERKSVSDLIQSLNSGRLYNQALGMTRHYSRPMLLIEFDENKPFDLQDKYYLSTDTSLNLLVTKLQLFTLHFPKLRIIWSPSPQATAELFEELKQGNPEPDAAMAAELNVDETSNDEDTFNPAIQSFLSKLPGVTTKNVYSLLHKGVSLDHLKSLSQAEISSLVDNSAEGEVIYDSFHKFHRPENEECKNKPGAFRGKRKRFH